MLIRKILIYQNRNSRAIRSECQNLTNGQLKISRISKQLRIIWVILKKWDWEKTVCTLGKKLTNRQTKTAFILFYVITYIDYENGWCVGSRRAALEIRRKLTRRNPPLPGQMIPCRILAPGRKHVLMTYGGYDFSATPKDLTYGIQTDLREDYWEVVGVFLED